LSVNQNILARAHTPAGIDKLGKKLKVIKIKKNFKYQKIYRICKWPNLASLMQKPFKAQYDQNRSKHFIGN
jgi:hypothetical protein